MPDVLTIRRSPEPIAGCRTFLNRFQTSQLKRSPAGPGNSDGTTVTCQSRVTLPFTSNLALLSSALVQVLKVALGYLGLVTAAEYTDLEVSNLGIGRRLSACRLESSQVLVNDLIGVDVLSNILPRLLVGNELLRACEIDTILSLKLARPCTILIEPNSRYGDA